MRLLLIALVCGCAASAAPLAADHPSLPSAPVGRLAPAPPSLRAGVIAYPDVPATPPAREPHHHHHHKP